jgi:hypothetical protein
VCGRLGAAASTAVVGVGSECLRRVLVGQQACENRICNAALPVLGTCSDSQLSCFAYTPVGSAKKHASKTERCRPCVEWFRCKWFAKRGTSLNTILRTHAHAPPQLNRCLVRSRPRAL